MVKRLRDGEVAAIDDEIARLAAVARDESGDPVDVEYARLRIDRLLEERFAITEREAA